MAQRFVIKDGMAVGFADELKLPLVGAVKRRVSVILPCNALLRCAFIAVRAVVADESWLANWTRKWNCDWIVVIDDTRHGPFRERSAAIQFEKKLIQDSGKLETFLVE